MDTKLWQSAIAAMALASVAWGDESYVAWTNLTFSNASGVQSMTEANTLWGVPANWTNFQGEALSVAPTNGADRFVIGLPSLESPPAQTSSVWPYTWTLSTRTSGKAYSVNPAIVSISGGERYTIKHSSAVVNWIDYSSMGERKFTVENPNDFMGFWRTEEPNAYLDLAGATGDFVPVVHNLFTEFRGQVSVPADGIARVDTLADDGILVKRGQGELQIGQTVGEQGGLHVRAGKIALDGVDPDGQGLSMLLAKATFHLDATAGDSLVKSNAEGRVWVTRWNDVRGNGRYAYVPAGAWGGSEYYVQSTHAPFLSENASGTGLDMVDFGSRSQAKVDTEGPLNCAMAFSSVSAREVFFAARYKSNTGQTPVVNGGAYPFHVSDNSLALAQAAYAVKAGDLAFNGAKVDASFTTRTAWITNTFVYAAGTTASVLLDTLATDRGLTGRLGGMAIGEVLIFDEPLTRTERTRINRYLNSKWRTGAADETAFGPVLAPDGLEVSVPAGKKARLADVALGDGKTLVKTGEGELAIGTLSPSNAPVRVEGGVVRFEGPRVDSDTAAPAAPDEATFWFDASSQNAFDTTESEGVEYITAWKDCRVGHESTRATARSSTSAAPALPRRVPNAYGSLTAVSFGTGATRSYVTFPVEDQWNTAINSPMWTRTAFIVLRANQVTTSSPLFFAGSDNNIDYLRSYSNLLATNYERARPNSANWTINGVPANLQSEADCTPLFQTNDFVVVAFDSLLGQRVKGLAIDRDVQSNSYGQWTVGEVLTYNRRLTASEKRTTEAYLMKKWTGLDHPASVASKSVQDLAFADDATVAVSAGPNADVTVTSLVGGNGSYVKSGAGTVTLPTKQGEDDVTSVKVEEGTLVTDFASAYVDTAYTRFDASRPPESGSYTVSENGTTNLNSVTSCGSHKETLSMVKASWVDIPCVVAPRLATVETRPGVTRTVFDMGYCIAGSSSAAAKSDSSYESAGFSGSGTYQIREMHTVYADKVDDTHKLRNAIFGSWKNFAMRGTGGSASYNRSAALVDASQSSTAYVANGYLAVDGEQKQPSDLLAEGFHLVSSVPLVDEESEGATDTILKEPWLGRSQPGTAMIGGCQIAEAVFFTHTNSVKTRTFLQKSLMHKWFGSPAPKWERAIGTVEVSSGATWQDAADDADFSIRTLKLAGSAQTQCGIRLQDVLEIVPGAEVAGGLTIVEGATVNVKGLDRQDAALSVSGTLHFEGSVTVMVSPSAAGKMKAGTYPLFTASESLTGFDPAACTLVLDQGAFAKRTARLRYDAQTRTVLLDVFTEGHAIIFR